jgi:hypothetical protein
MKKIYLVLIAVFLILSQAHAVFAKQELKEEPFDSVKAKHELMNKHSNKFKELSKEESNKRTTEIQQALNELAAEVAAGKKTKKEAKLKLEKMDVYLLEDPTENSEETGEISISSVGSTDVTMNKVWISYDSYTKRWNVTGGGYWANNNWVDDQNCFWWGYAGEICNVGGVDSVGITYYNTNSGYGSTSVVSSLGFITDHNGWEKELKNPSHGDGKNGIAFDYQDQIKLTKGGDLTISSKNTTYLGKGFSASITYNSNFANYNGKARTMYAHTWKETTITSIGFSGGKESYGASISWSHNVNRWAVYSPSDASF